MSVIHIAPVDDSSCRALWLAVIRQNLIDLSSGKMANDIRPTVMLAHRLRRKDAYEWFFSYNEDFVLVCDLAGVEPEVIRERALEVKVKPELLGYYSA